MKNRTPNRWLEREECLFPFHSLNTTRVKKLASGIFAFFVIVTSPLIAQTSSHDLRIPLVNSGSYADVPSSSVPPLTTVSTSTVKETQLAHNSPSILSSHTHVSATHLSAFSDPVWIKTYNGSANAIDAAYFVAADPDGNVYVAGQSQGLGSGYDIVTIKYSSFGIQEWVARYDGPGNGDDFPKSLAIDFSGNIIVVGDSYGGSFSESDYVIIKYNRLGAQQWVNRHNGEGSGRDELWGLATDDIGNVYVTGYSESINGGDDYVTIKYAPTGIRQWRRVYDFNGDGATALAVDPAGNVYVTGVSGNSLETMDYATVKYNSAGTQQWVVRYNGDDNLQDLPVALALDAQSNIYITGYSLGNSSDFDATTIKYSASGNLQWVAKYNGPGNGDDKAYRLRLDKAGDVYIAGFSLNNNNNLDWVTIKYNAVGQQKWVARYNGATDDKDIPSGLDIDSQGNVYLTGWTKNANSGFDCMSVRYTSSGATQWQATYNGPGNADDFGNALVLDAQGNLYVAGRAHLAGSGDDFVLLKYGEDSFPTSVHSNDLSSDNTFLLRQNYPNPFNAATAIQYELPREAFVSLKIYDMLGREVASLVNNRQQAGFYHVNWDASTQPTGIYLYRLQAGEYVDAKKLILLR